jgi:ribosomal protein L37E
MKSPFNVLLEAVERGLTLSIRGNRLSVIPRRRCPKDFAGVLRAHKTKLVRLLKLRFFITRVSNEPAVFLVLDEDTRQQLIGFGAKVESISKPCVRCGKRLNWFPEEDFCEQCCFEDSGAANAQEWAAMKLKLLDYAEKRINGK